MESAGHLPLTGLEWKQPSAFTRSFELLLGDERVASLVFQKVFGSLALAEWGREQWAFERSGFLRPRVTARRPDQEEELARYVPHWTGRRGILHGPGARERQFCVINLLATEFEWKDEQGRTLVSIKTRGVVHSAGELCVTDAGAEDDDIVLLILVGWYLVQLARQDAATHASST